MGMKRDQRGFTIVELLIAVAILSIVVAAVCGFILVGSRSYAAGNSDISVQQEAQLALNQMSDVMIDTTRSVNYVGYDASGSPVHALKDAEFTFTPEEKSLIMFNGVVEGDPSDASTQTVAAGNGNKHYHFYWSKADETLYYTELNVDPANDVDTKNIHFPAFDPTDPDWVVLAGHVTDFSVDLSQVEEKRVVQLALTFLDGRKEYVTSNNVTIRNKVGVNDAELSPLNKKKTLSVAARDKGVIIEPGETYHFSTPKVTGENVADRSVTWSLESPVKSGTYFTDTANGILKVATDEPGGTIKVAITTNAVDSNGDHASCTVDVDIKRVREVNLSANAEGTEINEKGETVYLVSAGGTYTITADVLGHKLGELCSVCGDDIDMDRSVGYEGNPYGNPYVWRLVDPKEYDPSMAWWNPEQFLTMGKGDGHSLEVTIAPNTPDGGDHVFVIQAMSILSTQNKTDGRTYHEWVPGAITLKVVKGNKNIHADGSLHWGSSTVVNWNELPYYHYYIVCARIREYGTEGNDKIMMYLTEGTTTRVTPDMFGVEDVSKPWYLSLQVLNPGKEIPPGVGLSTELNVGAQVSDPTVLDIIDDYLNNCDSSGTYVGTKYLHSDKLEATINPPEIYYEYNGEKNLGGELKLKKVTTLSGPASTEFKVDYVRNTRDEVLGYWFANDNVKFSVYKETAGGGLQKIYWYNAEGDYYEGDSRPYGGLLQLDEIKSAAGVKIKLDFNNMNRASEAEGKYRLIPTILYEQNSGADHAGGNFLYYLNYKPNYNNKQCYEDKRSTVYYELVNGGNVEAFWSYAYNQFTKGEIYFPTPSDSSFTNYFDRENLSLQNAKKLDDFSKTINGSSNTTVYQPSSMRCKYFADKKVYELELFYNYYDFTWGRTVEVSAGVFQCAPDGNKWGRKERGTLDGQLQSGNMNPQVNGGPTADVNFSGIYGDAYTGKMYIPLPSESTFTSGDNNGFDFKQKQSAVQTREWKKLKYQETGKTNVEEKDFAKVTCTYDEATDEYTLQLWQIEWSSGTDKSVATFTCKSDGKEWKQQP